MEPTPVKVVVTDRDEAEKIKPQTLETAKGQADIRIIPMSPVKQAFTRALRAYVQNVVWKLTATTATAAAITMADIPPEVKNALWFAYAVFVTPVGPALICFLQNLIEIWTKIDSKNPELRA